MTSGQRDGSDQHGGYWVVGRTVRASNEDPSAIGALWGGLFSDPFLEKVTGRTSDEVHSVYCNYEGDHTAPYSVVLGYRVDQDIEVPEGLHKQHIALGTFVHYQAVGEQPAALIETWQRIWGEAQARAFEADVEVHRGDGTTVDIWVGIR